MIIMVMCASFDGQHTQNAYHFKCYQYGKIDHIAIHCGTNTTIVPVTQQQPDGSAATAAVATSQNSKTGGGHSSYI